MKLVALADSDSYVKWSAALLGALPDTADAELLIVETPLVVSASQQRAALAGSGLDDAQVRRIAFSDVAAYLAKAAPDAALIAARGPVVRVLARQVAALEPRPVIVTGLPGISIPATRAALIHRTQCDLFILHSTREIDAFTELAESGGFAQRFALSRLPFAEREIAAAEPGGTDLVFAGQAVVPRTRGERMQIARMLLRAAEADPTRRVVVKLRGVKGEKQTHHEHDGYPELLAECGPLPANVVISTAPMADALREAEGLVTVSSTAVIEAVACGIPAIVLDTFGVSDELINPVFVGSGMLAGETAVVDRAFRTPNPEWLAENYFHSPDEDDWFTQIATLVTERRLGMLPQKPPRVRRGGRVRDLWDETIIVGRRERSLRGTVVLAVGAPLRAVLRLFNRARATVRAAVRPSQSASALPN